MAENVEVFTVFLASPGDVAAERTQARDVIEEVNRTVGREKRIRLEAVGWDTDAYPGYGTDGQAIINAQIADMTKHDLFVGIMWNRFGTPTPRAGSGTEEEFDLAEAAFRQSQHPHIMFYFCQRPYNLGSQAELEQKGKVLQFKSRVQANGLTCDYVDVSEFRASFHRHLRNWLVQRTAGTPKPPPTNATPSSSSTTATSPEAASPSAVLVSASAPAPERVVDSGMWTLLGESFYNAESVNEHNGTVLIEIVPQGPEEDATLRALQNSVLHRSGETLPFAHQNMAGIATVHSVDRRSAAGRTVWAVTLRIEDNRGGHLPEVAYSNYSADQLAEMRARLILLNEHPSGSAGGRSGLGQRAGNVDSRMLDAFVRGMSGRQTPESSPLHALWQRFLGRTEQFLPLSRLWAVYHLLSTNTVEHILQLEMGPLRGDRLHVRFRGRRSRYYSNVAPVEITVEGDCDLSTS